MPGLVNLSKMLESILDRLLSDPGLGFVKEFPKSFFLRLFEITGAKK